MAHRSKNDEILYTSETPYYLIGFDFKIKFRQQGLKEHELDAIHNKWTKIGKLTNGHALVGMKYV